MSKTSTSFDEFLEETRGHPRVGKVQPCPMRQCRYCWGTGHVRVGQDTNASITECEACDGIGWVDSDHYYFSSVG